MLGLIGPTAEGIDDNVGVAVGVVTEELIAGATADDVGSGLPGDETKGGISELAVTHCLLNMCEVLTTVFW